MGVFKLSCRFRNLLLMIPPLFSFLDVIHKETDIVFTKSKGPETKLLLLLWLQSRGPVRTQYTRESSLRDSDINLVVSLSTRVDVPTTSQILLKNKFYKISIREFTTVYLLGFGFLFFFYGVSFCCKFILYTWIKTNNDPLNDMRIGLG